MRTVTNRPEHVSVPSWSGFLGACVVLPAAIVIFSSGAGAQPSASDTRAADAPVGLPPEKWKSSPHHAVIDGWGRTIPCRCRFNGKSYQLGEIVCMKTHVGTVLTRCDIFENNTSWMPSRQPCEPDAGS